MKLELNFNKAQGLIIFMGAGIIYVLPNWDLFKSAHSWHLFEAVFLLVCAALVYFVRDRKTRD